MYEYYSTGKNVTSVDIYGTNVVAETHAYVGYYPKTFERYNGVKYKVRYSKQM